MHTNFVLKKISLIGPIMKMILSPIFKHMIHTGRPYEAGHMLRGYLLNVKWPEWRNRVPWEVSAHWWVSTRASCGSDTTQGLKGNPFISMEATLHPNNLVCTWIWGSGRLSSEVPGTGEKARIWAHVVWAERECPSVSARKKESLVIWSCPTLCDPMDCSLPGSSIHGIFPRKSTGVGFDFLLQRIFLTQGSNLGLPHCRQTLYHLNRQGSSSVYAILSLRWAGIRCWEGSTRPTAGHQ